MLTEALRTGEAQSEAKTGGDFFATVYADPESCPLRSGRALNGT